MDEYRIVIARSEKPDYLLFQPNNNLIIITHVVFNILISV